MVRIFSLEGLVASAFLAAAYTATCTMLNASRCPPLPDRLATWPFVRCALRRRSAEVPTPVDALTQARVPLTLVGLAASPHGGGRAPMAYGTAADAPRRPRLRAGRREVVDAVEGLYALRSFA